MCVCVSLSLSSSVSLSLGRLVGVALSSLALSFLGYIKRLRCAVFVVVGPHGWIRERYLRRVRVGVTVRSVEMRSVVVQYWYVGRNEGSLPRGCVRVYRLGLGPRA